jgi:hypothetical protein
LQKKNLAEIKPFKWRSKAICANRTLSNKLPNGILWDSGDRKHDFFTHFQMQNSSPKCSETAFFGGSPPDPTGGGDFGAAMSVTSTTVSGRNPGNDLSLESIIHFFVIYVMYVIRYHQFTWRQTNDRDLRYRLLKSVLMPCMGVARDTRTTAAPFWETSLKIDRENPGFFRKDSLSKSWRHPWMP